MNSIVYKNIFSKINYNEINKVAFMYIRDFIKDKKEIKYIKEIILNYDKENIIISNYIYLNRLQNNDSNNKNIYKVYLINKLSIYLLFRNNTEKKDYINNIYYIISKLSSDLKIKKQDHNLNLSIFKLFDPKTINIIKNQGKIIGDFFLNISINSDLNYYNYGYKLFILIITNMINHENKLLIFQEKINLKFNINKILFTLNPLFSNYIIINNNKKFKKNKKEKKWVLLI